MPLSRRHFLKRSAALTAGLSLLKRGADAIESVPLAKGPFQPTWESLQAYRCPEWFRDAKFGIWAHWTAQCVPEQGDWYARQMYLQGEPDYAYHAAHYGHPSKVGFKEIDHLWHAERWEPERLIDLYHAAGAKYFVALANHHDNFDNWNSRHQSWNSVNLGPKKDIVGTWAKLARKRGMRFGVTVHAARAWDWFDVSHGSDKTGPLAGVPYDGGLTLADGKGAWWEGYDPAELYGPAGAARTPEAFAAYELKFYRRVMDLLDQHHPDLLYFDDGEPPTSYGLQIAANYYNLNRRRHQDHLEAVLTAKSGSPRVKESMVLDYERGRSDEIAKNPWQTDTCIGDWHYRRSLYENHQYKTAEQVIRMLVDIVSKNGCLLLNIPLRGDGSIDSDETAFIGEMAKWMGVNGESIFGTRPWKISGEGPVTVRGGGFSEGGENRLTSEDFRFATKDGILYATAMGWPEDGRFVIKCLGASAAGIKGDAKRVEMLGVRDPLPFVRTAEGLAITPPERKPCDHAWAFKIAGFDLEESQPIAVHDAKLTRAAADGSLMLSPEAATLKGSRIQYQSDATPNIGFWDDPKDEIAWRVRFDAPGEYAVELKASAANGDSSLLVEAGSGASATLSIPKTGGWDDYRIVNGASIKISQPGERRLTVRPADPSSWHAVNLASVALHPLAGK